METAAAILVETAFASSDYLQQKLFTEGIGEPDKVAEIMTPYYVAMMRALKKAKEQNPELNL